MPYTFMRHSNLLYLWVRDLFWVYLYLCIKLINKRSLWMRGNAFGYHWNSLQSILIVSQSYHLPSGKPKKKNIPECSILRLCKIVGRSAARRYIYHRVTYLALMVGGLYEVGWYFSCSLPSPFGINYPVCCLNLAGEDIWRRISEALERTKQKPYASCTRLETKK